MHLPAWTEQVNSEDCKLSETSCQEELFFRPSRMTPRVYRSMVRGQPGKRSGHCHLSLLHVRFQTGCWCSSASCLARNCFKIKPRQGVLLLPPSHGLCFGFFKIIPICLLWLIHDSHCTSYFPFVRDSILYHLLYAFAGVTLICMDQFIIRLC